MVDTIRFKIPQSEILLQSIRDNCVVVKRSKKNEQISIYTIDKLYLGSFDRHINIQVDSGDNVYIEFSAPKYKYGHNLFLLYPESLKETLSQLYIDLVTFFGIFPELNKWILQRVDLCYSWKLKNEEDSTNAISILKTLSFSRKQPYSRAESIMYIGSAYSVKFYQKYKEFFKHDYKDMLKEGKLDEATELLLFSKGILRFEASLKRKQVDFEFGERSNYEVLLDQELLIRLLNKYLGKYFNNLSPKTMEEKDIEKKLIERYGKTKGIQLFQFYNMYFSETEWYKQSLRNNYHRTQITTKLKDIAKANVGISNQNLALGFEFAIPSKDVVNIDDSSPVKTGDEHSGF